MSLAEFLGHGGYPVTISPFSNKLLEKVIQGLAGLGNFWALIGNKIYCPLGGYRSNFDSASVIHNAQLESSVVLEGGSG